MRRSTAERTGLTQSDAIAGRRILRESSTGDAACAACHAKGQQHATTSPRSAALAAPVTRSLALTSHVRTNLYLCPWQEWTSHANASTAQRTAKARKEAYAIATRCPVLTQRMVLPESVGQRRYQGSLFSMGLRVCGLRRYPRRWQPEPFSYCDQAVSAYAPATPCPAVSGTEIAYAAMLRYVMCGTEIMYGAALLCCAGGTILLVAVSGTEIAYAATLPYPMCGTEVAYAATRIQEEIKATELSLLSRQ
eukprot:2815717-Rhodomonas_salina.4